MAFPIKLAIMADGIIAVSSLGYQLYVGLSLTLQVKAVCVQQLLTDTKELICLEFHLLYRKKVLTVVPINKVQFAGKKQS